MTKLASALKVSLHVALFVVFLIFFGFPAIEKYQKKETVVVSSEELTNGIEAPSLTIMGLNSIKGIGWKTPQYGLDSWNSFRIDEHCAKLDKTNFEECFERDSYHLTDVVKSAQSGYSSKNEWHTSPLNASVLFWTQDLTATNMGRHFTLKPKTIDDMFLMFLHKNLTFFICVHYENFFLVNTNPLGPPSNCKFYKHPYEKFPFFLD